MDAAALAAKLGLDETKVSDALDAVRGTMHDQTTGERPDPAARQQAFAEALASELGVSADQVSAALGELRAEADASRKASFQTELDAAIAAGTLTQAEADAVMKAADAGVIGYGGRGRR